MAEVERQDVWNFYVIQTGDSVTGVFSRLYGLTSKQVVGLLPAIASRNPHIKDLNKVRAGQILDLGLAASSRSLNHSADLLEMEHQYSALSPAERKLVHENPHALNMIAGWLGSLAVNVPDAGFTTIETLVKNYAETVEKYGSELSKSYAAGARGTMKTELMNKVLAKQPVQDALRKIPTFVQKQLLANAKKLATPFSFKEGAVLRETRAILRLAPKSLSTYNPFSGVIKEYARVARYAKYGGAITTWIIPTATGIYDSYQAYGTSGFGVTASKSAGNVVGGALGTGVGYYMCNFFLGFPSGGTSFFGVGLALVHCWALAAEKGAPGLPRNSIMAVLSDRANLQRASKWTSCCKRNNVGFRPSRDKR